MLVAMKAPDPVHMPCMQIWNCSQEQSNHIVHEFFKSQHFNNGIPVIPGMGFCAANRSIP